MGVYDGYNLSSLITHNVTHTKETKMGVYDGYRLYSLMTHNGYDRHGKDLWNLKAQFGNHRDAVRALRAHNRQRKLEGTLRHPAAQMFRFVSTRRVS